METLTPEEQKQFAQMETQEAEEQKIIKEEAVQSEPQEPVQERLEEPKPIPASVLAEERERRRTAEQEAATLRQNQIRMDERLSLIQQRLAPPEPQREIPDPSIDALGALKATTEEIKAFRKFREEQTQQVNENAQMQNIINQASMKEAEFIKDNPDYGQASEFLRKSRFNELTALGQSPVAAQKTMQQEAILLAQQALQQGNNPSDIVYKLAHMRGYSKTAITQSSSESDVAKLARIAEGQKSNMSLGNVNSTPNKPQMNSKDLLAMDDESFGKWLEKLPAKERSKFLGA